MIPYRKRIIFLGIICGCYLFISCSSGKNGKDEVFVISSLAKTDSSHFTASPIKFYSKFNFIIDSSGLIYYYSLRHKDNVCGGGSFEKPIFIDLTPEQIVQIPQNTIIDFIKCNVLDNNKEKVNISIASEKDTIKSKEFSTMFSFLHDSPIKLHYCIRKTTSEENIVLFYKQRKWFYEPTKIYWDSTKTVFYTTPVVVVDTTELQY